MPLSCKEVVLYPKGLLDAAAAGVSDRQWWAVYTKSRQEKAFARQLLSHGVPYYLPLVLKNYTCRRRRFSAHVPLFSGYVFMHGSEQERIVSLTTNRVSKILPVPDAPGLIHDLRQIFRLIASGAPLTIEQRLAAGRPAGADPLRGTRRSGRHRGDPPGRHAAAGRRELPVARGLRRGGRPLVGNNRLRARQNA
jgi:transcriptional antiterminator RfaH